MTTILLARHGQTDWNAELRWQGHADPPLNDVGRGQSLRLAESLAARPLEAIYSSDLSRARETAEIVGEALGLGVVCDRRLREVDVGEWSGLTSREIERLYPAGPRRRLEGGTGWTLGETYEAMGNRVVEALHEIADAHRRARVAVITHGGPMRAVWLATAGKLSGWRRVSNCDVVEIAVEDGTIVWRASSRAERPRRGAPSRAG